MIAKKASGLLCSRTSYAVAMDEGSPIPTRSIVIATGAQYRRPQLENLGQYEGNGIYYGATFVEAQLCVGEDVIIIGGGNSAGQAAVFLSEAANHVYLLVRSSGLAESMSRYLIRRIEETPAISLLTNAEITELDGVRLLERVRWRNNKTGKDETHDIRHVFIMAGALPNTGWLHGCVVTGAVSSRRVQTFRQTISRRRIGRSPVRLICSRRVCPEYSRSATSAPPT